MEHRLHQAEIWQEQVVIPTYGIGKADRNPMFLEKRVYQGSSGKVYPLELAKLLVGHLGAILVENDGALGGFTDFDNLFRGRLLILSYGIAYDHCTFSFYAGVAILAEMIRVTDFRSV